MWSAAFLLFAVIAPLRLSIPMIFWPENSTGLTLPVMDGTWKCLAIEVSKEPYKSDIASSCRISVYCIYLLAF